MVAPPPADEPVKEARMPFQFTCQHCGASFTWRNRFVDAKHAPRRYCSNACRYAAGSGSRPFLERFWEKVDKNGPVPAHRPELGPCWLWTGKLRAGGYGKIRRNGKALAAHRVSWELANNAELGPLLALHDCDNPACVNPDHLHAGTPLMNTQEMLERSRAIFVRGESVGSAKLDDERVREILRRHAAGESQADLGRTFGVSKRQIHKIVHRRSWKHL